LFFYDVKACVGEVVLLYNVFGIGGNIFIWGFVRNNFNCFVFMRDFEVSQRRIFRFNGKTIY
jgi:hypothetical protein